MSVNPIIIKSVSPLALARAYNIANVTGLRQPGNPYEGKIDQTTNKDAAAPKKSYIDTPLLLGPVMTDLQLDAVEYTESRTGRKIRTQELHFACVLINITQPKNIVKTEIDGVDFTVKEYIGLGDYQVDISGIIVGENGHYPQAEVNALLKMLNAPVAIPVVNRQLNNAGIFYLVVENYNLPQDPGSYSKQAFSMNTISDYPIQLQIQ